MSDKPKRTITPEQLEKMKEGRKKAMEERRKLKEQIKTEEKEAKVKERRLAKEAEKQKAAELKAKKDAEKKKELEQELQALQMQKDRIDSMKKTVEHRKNFRAKIREVEVPDISDVSEAAEAAVEAEEDADYEGYPEANDEPDVNEEHHKMFVEQVEKLSGSLSSEKSKEVFNGLVKGYDKSNDITTNLNKMSAKLKQIIKDNITQIKKNENVIAKEQEKEEVVMVETKDEYRYKSQLSSLMRLR